MSQSVIIVTPEELKNIVCEAVRIEIIALRKENAVSKTSFTEKEAAEYLGHTPSTLRIWRSQGKGPKYHKQGRSVRYLKTDMDAWREDGKVFTSEAPDAPHR